MILHKDVTNLRVTKWFSTAEEKFNEIHNNKYDYSKAVYVNAHTDILIICPVHGQFSQQPNNHMNGKGCVLCGIERVGRKRGSLAVSTFIRKATVVHNGFYTYSHKPYVNGYTTITCPLHGEFNQIPNNHLNGQGCKKCFNDKLSLLKTRTTADFILLANAKHNNKYDYSLTNYTGSKSNVVIICKDHGEFTQQPGNHLHGAGCQKCATYGFDLTRPAVLYYFGIKFNDSVVWKVGVTNKSINERYYKRDLSRITVAFTCEYTTGSEALVAEKAIIKWHSALKYEGESPFTDRTRITECFKENIMDKHNQLTVTNGIVIEMELTLAGKPSKPIGVGLRDCNSEGEPLE